MRSTIKVVAGFALGLASGAFGAWCIAKKRYEEIAQEEIDSVKEVYASKMVEANKTIKERFEFGEAEDPDETPEIDPEEVEECEEVIERLDYTRYSTPEEEKKGPKPEPVKKVGQEKPYVIDESEFGENEDYETITLIWYSDKILADDMDEIVEDVDETVGYEALGYLGEDKGQEVLVRNDRRKCDYSVEYSQRTYEEVLEAKPYLRRGVL